MDLLLKKKFAPNHQQNKMMHEGDVVKAREYFFKRNNKNLLFLVQKRFEWMNKFIDKEMIGIEVGAGSGFSKDYINNKNFKITDYSNHPWLDLKNIDALHLPYENDSLDFIVSSNMIHHVPYVLNFFEEMQRVLKPGGKLLIQEINGSYMMRLVLNWMKHEGYDFNINIWDKKTICTNPNDLWSANCVIPNLVFNDVKLFQKNIPYFDTIHHKYVEFFTLFNSGGIIAKTKYIPLPITILNLVYKIDNVLCKIAPNFFALQRQIVLVKKY